LHSPVATTASVLVHPEYFIGRWAGEVEMGAGKWGIGSLAAMATFEPKLKPNKCHASNAANVSLLSGFPSFPSGSLENTHPPC